MDCAQTHWLSNKEYLQQFNRKVTQQRIPLSGSIELTPRCNLRCVHCYLGEQETLHQQRHLEMSTSQVKSILDQITAAGCLFLLITGGDPLLRRDFPEIYRHAKQNGLIVAVFTNGTLITDSILNLFVELPPRVVEISFYGATEATYEQVTGIKGSYKQCLNGLQRLLNHHIRVGLKTMLMTYNQHEFEAMKKMAANFGVKFRSDPGIFPRFDGDKLPVSLRISPKEAVERDLSIPNRRERWREYFDRFGGSGPKTDTLYQCGAGLASFHINAQGYLQPCIMANRYRYNLLSGDFFTGWQKSVPSIREKKASNTYACRECDKKFLCSLCPAFAELESGSEEGRSDYMCAVGHYRYEAIKNNISEKVPDLTLTEEARVVQPSAGTVSNVVLVE